MGPSNSTSRSRKAILYSKGVCPMVNKFNNLLSSNQFSANNLRKNPSMSTKSIKKPATTISTSCMKYFRVEGRGSSIK